MPQNIYLFDSCQRDDFGSLATKLHTYSDKQDSILKAHRLCPENARIKHENIIGQIFSRGRILQTAETTNFIFYSVFMNFAQHRKPVKNTQTRIIVVLLFLIIFMITKLCVHDTCERTVFDGKW